MQQRCSWCQSDPLYIQYHDEAWGVPVHEDRVLFEMLTLEGAQAGLSWLTVLKKQRNYRNAFDHFDIEAVSKYTEDKINHLMIDSGIVRNKLKVESVIKNAKGILQIQKEFGSFDRFIWNFVDGNALQNKWRTLQEVPSQTEISKKMSKALKNYGFNFVGPTICYAFMQAIGMVNDHFITCFRHKEIEKISS
ncbi:MAG: DNA-3-methyladenine glycosylase [Pseudomonadota bacterium]|jgi:DNA-3-methyladenine glycosylase I